MPNRNEFVEELFYPNYDLHKHEKPKQKTRASR